MWWRFALQIVSSKLQMCNTETVSVFHSEALQVTASEGLAQGPYVAASRNNIISFIQALSIAPLQSTTTQRHSRHNTDTVSEFHSEAPQATASEGLAQGPYVAARAGFEPMTLRA